MAKTKAGPGTALATIPKTGIAKQDITEREALQIALRKANVEISDKTLGVLFDEEIEILTDWADKYPEDPELERAWHSALPDFMEFRDTADAGSYQIWHKNQAKETDGPGNGDPVIDAEFQAGPEITATEVVNKTADVNLEAENQRLREDRERIREANEDVRMKKAERDFAEEEVQEAKAHLKTKQAEYKKAVVSLSALIDDIKSGQRQLPFGDD